MLNVNGPSEPATGVSVTRLGKRIYEDTLRKLPGEAPERAARHGAAEPVVTYGQAERIAVYGVAAGHDDQQGTDLHAVASGRISVTPVSLHWTDDAKVERLGGAALQAVLDACAGGAPA